MVASIDVVPQYVRNPFARIWGFGKRPSKHLITCSTASLSPLSSDGVEFRQPTGKQTKGGKDEEAFADFLHFGDLVQRITRDSL